MNTKTITVMNPVYCQASKDLIPHIAKFLEFKKTIILPSPKGKRKRIVPAYAINRKTGQFLTGLLPRVEKSLANRNFGITVENESEQLTILNPKVDSIGEITLRDYQKTIIRNAITKGRGIIQAATGAGKTIIAMGIINSYGSTKKVLFLCHSVAIINQVSVEMEKLGIKTSRFTGKEKDLSGQVVCATIQTMSRIAKNYSTYFDMIIVDEAHHCFSDKSSYGKFLKVNTAPARFGFTATLHKEKEKVLFSEGLLGPVLNKFSIKEGVRRKVLVKPKVRLEKVPYNTAIANYRKYSDIYVNGVVKNLTRNRIILKNITRYNEQGKTCLVIVKEIEHGNQLLKLFENAGQQAVFVQYATEDKEQIRQLFIKKKIKTVIATATWKEGIDIPTLDVIVYAAGLKSEISTLQGIGRAFRLAEGKEEAIIVDFLDPYHYLASHCIHRLQIYQDQGWL